MTLREDLKNFVPMYLWEKSNHSEGYIVPSEEYNARWNLLQVQGDQQANTLRDILFLLYGTVLNDTDGATHIKVTMPEYTGTNVTDVLRTVDTRLKQNATALVNHKASGDHDDRYYTKQDLIPWLRGGDTNIKEEVFTIVDPNLGDGTFTYTRKGQLITGNLTGEGGQIFELQNGYYDMGTNRIEVIINDTLRRSVASGGIEELTPTSFILTSPEGAGAEITTKYYERLGIAAEYNIKLSETKPPKNDGKTMWFEVI